MNIAQFYLRLALGIDFLYLGLDRFGTWGPNGSANASWGDWQHFSAYAHELMFFLPADVAEGLAILATIGELLFGLLLIIGWNTRFAATGTGLLTGCFAIVMFVQGGFVSPVNYSVFAVSAAGFVLGALPSYAWSIDAILNKNKKISLNN